MLKKKFKRIVSVALLSAMIVSSVSVSAPAYESSKETVVEECTEFSDDLIVEENVIEEIIPNENIDEVIGESSNEIVEINSSSMNVDEVATEKVYDESAVVESVMLADASSYSKISNPRIVDGVTTWDCVYFGKYWQNDTNGDGFADQNDNKEKIKWRVLSVQNNKALLLSDKVLDGMQYDEKCDDVSVSWNNSMIRSWLNGYGNSTNHSNINYSKSGMNFIGNAFSSTEKNDICYGSDKIQDKVFILEHDDVNGGKYGNKFSALATLYAGSHGAQYITDGRYPEGTSSWWLRSKPPLSLFWAHTVGYAGEVTKGNQFNTYEGIRPAIYINLTNYSWEYAGEVTSDGVVTPPGEFSGGSGRGYITIPGEDSRLIDVFCNDYAFGEDSDGYIHDIARYSAGLSTLAYASDSIVIDSLGELGYKNVKINKNYFPDPACKSDASGTGEYSPCWIVHKEITVDGVKLVLLSVIIRGTYHEEWIDNFDPGTSETHKGFNKAADYVYDNLITYINKNNLSNKKLKILITGHSRGGATGNLVGKKLNDNVDNYSYLTKENIFVYTYATPNTSKIAKYDGYENIFSIVNPEDFVTKVLPTKWGYKRYGKTYVLPSSTTEIACGRGYVDYESWKNKYFEPKFEKYKGVKYVGYNKGMIDVSEYVSTVTSSVGNINDYYKKNRTYNNTSLKDLYTYTLGYHESTNKSKKEIAYLNLLKAAEGGYGPLGGKTVAYFFINQLLAPRFAHAHCAEKYLAAMNSLTYDEVIQDRLELYGIVNCPVDVTIKDEKGSVIGAIENNDVDVSYSLSSNMVVTGESKTFMLPAKANYTIELEGNDVGDMDYSLCMMNPDTGEIERIYYKDIPLANGIKYVCEYAPEKALENQKLEDESNNEISITNYLNESQLGKLSVNVEVQGYGTASGFSNLTQGDYITLIANTDSNNSFLGWYSAEGNLISTESEYGISVEGNESYIAKFTNNTVSANGIVFEENTINMYVGEEAYNNSSLLPTNATAVMLVYSSGDDSIVSVDELGIITAKKAGIADIYAETPDKSIRNSYKVVVSNVPSTQPIPTDPVPTNPGPTDPATDKYVEKIIKISETEFIINLATNEKYTLAEIKREKADGKNYKISYSSKADIKVATMDSNGLASAKKEGTSIITVKKGDTIYTVTVNVFNPKFKKKIYAMNVGETFQPEYDDCKLKPIFSIPSKYKKNADIDKEKGSIAAKKKGTITVTAKVGEGKNARKVSTTVKIYDPKLYSETSKVKAGKFLQLYVKNGVKKTTDWKSSDEAIATVNSKGNVKGVSAGSVTISCVNNGKLISKEIIVK